MGKFRSTSYTAHERYHNQHRFEHWYRDNSIYFITSKVRDGFHAFHTDRAKEIFWDRFAHWTSHHGFEPWVVTLLSNHYHILGYLKVGANLGSMMQKLHGSVSKLVNDTLPARHLPFWRERGNRDYYDGCLRDASQLRRTYRYVLNQAVRARIVRRSSDYPHTRAYVAIDECLARAQSRVCYLPTIRYPRYEQRSH